MPQLTLADASPHLVERLHELVAKYPDLHAELSPGKRDAGVIAAIVARITLSDRAALINVIKDILSELSLRDALSKLSPQQLHELHVALQAATSPQVW